MIIFINVLSYWEFYKLKIIVPKEINFLKFHIFFIKGISKLFLKMSALNYAYVETNR